MTDKVNNNIIYMCRVISVKDDNEGLRIKARIPFLDGKDKPLDEIPYAFPLLPKFTHVTPKENEMVFIFLQSMGDGKSCRFFLGPVISQPQKMNFDAYNYSAQSLLSGNQIAKPLPAASLNPDNRGTLPDREDVALQGRGNSDLILKPSELRLRCGFVKNPQSNTDDVLIFNKEDLGYIQMKYEKMKDHNNDEFSSMINIVADRINLLSHDSKTHFNLTDPDELIKKEEIQRIFENAHQLPYGDELMEFLDKFIRIFMNHTHPMAMDKPCLTEPDKKTLSINLDRMLSKSIRIN